MYKLYTIPLFVNIGTNIFCKCSYRVLTVSLCETIRETLEATQIGYSSNLYFYMIGICFLLWSLEDSSDFKTSRWKLFWYECKCTHSFVATALIILHRHNKQRAQFNRGYRGIFISRHWNIRNVTIYTITVSKYILITYLLLRTCWRERIRLPSDSDA